MKNVTLITGNQNKADFFAKYLDAAIAHKKVDLDEIQSLDLRQICEHKARQAFETIKSPVLVEDTGLTIDALGKLPGPFIKWFIQELGLEGICRLVDAKKRGATAEICFGYFDGHLMKLFTGKVEGTIAEHPLGPPDFGWNPIFIPKGSTKTYAEMNDEETERFSLRTTTVYPELKKFLND